MASITHKTITQGRKTIVFGMPWYTVDDEESPRKSGVALSKEIQTHFDLIVARKEDAPQFGLATTTEGAKSGAYSAAAIVADLVPVDSWIFVLEIESSIWICCGRDGYIMPSGDRIYENREEARRAFHDLNPPSFKKVYLPSSWKVVGSSDDLSEIASDIEETDILDFIEYNPPKWGKLSSISSAGTILKVAAAAILLGSVSIAATSVIFSEKPVEMTQEQRDLLLKREAERLANLSRSEREQRWAAYDSNRPWYNAGPSSEVLETCLQQINTMPTNPVGYAVESIHCARGNVTAELKRTTGYSTWLEEWAQAYDDIDAVVSSTGDQGFLTRSFSIPGPRGAEQIASFQDVSKKILEVGQIEGSRVDLKTPAAAIVAEDPEYTPFYATGSYQITTRRPEAWIQTFTDIPGLTLSAINFNVKNQTYNMEGEIYVPNL
jgi:hypothetical protein